MKSWRQNIQVLAPVAAMLCLFMLVQAFGMARTAREANAIDMERTTLALRETLRGHADRIAGVASDNAYWDAAADAVYRPNPDLDFVKRTWGDSTADRTNYDGAYILDPEGHSIIGLRDGAVDPEPIDRRIGTELSLLARKPGASSDGIGGIVRMADGPALVGMARILPTSVRPGWRLPAAGAYRLVFIKRLDRNFLAKTGQSLLIDNLHIADTRSEKGGVPVVDVHGKPIAWLGWTPADPGMSAIVRALPLVTLALMIAIGLTAVILRQGLRFVNELSRQARIDSLSELPNRRALRMELKKRLDAQEHVVLCLIDLDGFKFINDNYGHGVGDHLIISCARMLTAMIEGGFVSRLGGDEFAFIISGERAWEQASMYSDEVLGKLSVPFRIGERTVLIGASIGLTQGYGDQVNADEMLRRADVAMYAAKRAGKMRSCVFDAELDRRQSRIHQIERELRQSLVTRDFRLVYQPLFDSASGGISGVEALLRWTSPTMGEMDPVDFIPVAEESGLIDPLGRFILQRACEETRDWDGVKVAVNVSAAQLRNPDFSHFVRQTLEQTGFPVNRLELEITETYLVADPDTAGKVLNELRDIGVSVALDDFGTGYASIGFLRQFQFDKLKLDRSLVVDAENSDAARALLQASVAMARALDMQVAAEGVETTGQADLMRVAGCDQLQGWLFDKAKSAAEISRLMEDAASTRQRKARRRRA